MACTGCLGTCGLTWSESDFIPPPLRTVEAQQHVAKRLEYMEGEMNKLNGLILEKQKAQKVLADKIVNGMFICHAFG